MTTIDMLRDTRLPLLHGSGAIPAVGFGTLIPDPLITRQATRTALEVGFRHLDCAERYRNEAAVGEAMREHAIWWGADAVGVGCGLTGQGWGWWRSWCGG